MITELAVMGYHDETLRMQVLSLHPGVTLEQVQENTSFDLPAAKDLAETEPPRVEELRILRQEVDPRGYLIRRE